MRKWGLLVLILMTTGAFWACSATNEYGKITAEQGKTLMENDSSIILVDVRTLEEYVSGHIEGALLLPLASLSADAETVVPDPQATYILYCRSGNRSGQAWTLLKQLGYTHVYDMGGIIDWTYGTVLE